MLDFFTHPDVAPFSVAALVLFGLLLIEIGTLLAGKPLSALIDHAVGHDGEFGTALDHAIDHSPHGAKPEGQHQGAFGTALDWLNAGRVPLLVLIIALLAAFAGLGMVLQIAARAFGFYVPALLAMVLVIVPAVVLTRHLSRAVASIVPRDESYAQTGTDFIGLVGEVTVGPAKKGVVARARIRDRHGNLHWPRVEPADPEHVIAAGSSVLVIEVLRGGVLAVTPADARLTEDMGRRTG